MILTGYNIIVGKYCAYNDFGGDIMASKSIYKNINIKSLSMCKRLVNALENAKNKSSKEVIYQKKVTEIKGSKIKDLFGDNI